MKKLREKYLELYKKWDRAWKEDGPTAESDFILRRIQSYVKRHGLYKYD